MSKKLYLCSYDIRDPKRLRKALQILNAYYAGKQYSVFECYLSDAEKECLTDDMEDLLHNEDSFFITKVSNAENIKTLGAAHPLIKRDFFYFG